MGWLLDNQHLPAALQGTHAELEKAFKADALARNLRDRSEKQELVDSQILTGVICCHVMLLASPVLALWVLLSRTR